MDKVLFKMKSGQIIVGSTNYSSLTDGLSRRCVEWVEIHKVKYPIFTCRDELKEDSSYIDECIMINLNNVEFFTILK